MPEFVPNFKFVISAVVIAVFLMLLGLESRFPLRQAKRSKLSRFWLNVVISGLALATGAFIVAPLALRVLAWASENSMGLLNRVSLPVATELVVGFLLMDLSFYYWHRANHSFPLFWRFHNVHHLDPDLDVSTSFRFHFGEVLYSVAFRVLQVSFIGVSFSTFLIYELFFQCATLFHHSNVRLPIGLERALNKIIVTPRMHGIHHSIVKDETNSNYSVIFRWWDVLHGTLRLNVKQSDVIIGVPAYRGPEDNKFLTLLMLPFRKQREYWRLPNGKQPERILSARAGNILLP
jgi:sterol desaturase/sphingolipid hydroxylase (fatty acid hydroxylase superfamily)